ncbi:hypothetical protein JRO89_XS02G0112200 [Xanthoceras sorbifolium]|uniref:Uncharacterized protein n=1 Tax=Xanthoceras sorbifolium TaxID=99658 RepID=A0ABQ8IFZ4_9ROSI|nr:hypothetical protein JRO89_XS02G0112200 [Xanthoceras sorbifolium]
MAAAASLYILKSSLLTPVSISQSNFPGKSDSGKVILKSRGYKSSRKSSPGEEPPESLFMKELRRRGMNPTSLLEDTNRTDYGTDEETKLREEEGGFSKRNAVSTELDRNLSNQRERSMALNSEGLEYFGSTFVHVGSNTPASSPQYVDPYELLEDERISQIAPSIN